MTDNDKEDNNDKESQTRKNDESDDQWLMTS